MRHTLVAKDKEAEWTDKALPGWRRTGETTAYAIYENENWMPMGFAFDYYVTADQLDRVNEDERAQILCRAVLLDDDQISAFGGILQPLPDEELTNRSEDAYAADCAARRDAKWQNLPRPAPVLRPGRTMPRTSWCFSVCRMTTALPPQSTANPPLLKGGRRPDGPVRARRGERDRIYLPYAGAEGVGHRERCCYRGVWRVFGNFAEEKERETNHMPNHAEQLAQELNLNVKMSRGLLN